MEGPSNYPFQVYLLPLLSMPLPPFCRSVSFFLPLHLAGMLFPSPQLQEHGIFFFSSTLKYFSIRCSERQKEQITHICLHRLQTYLLVPVLFRVVCTFVLSRDCRLFEDTIFTVIQLGIFY